jgi:hypothetical protein
MYAQEEKFGTRSREAAEQNPLPTCGVGQGGGKRVFARGRARPLILRALRARRFSHKGRRNFLRGSAAPRAPFFSTAEVPA